MNILKHVLPKPFPLLIKSFLPGFSQLFIIPVFVRQFFLNLPFIISDCGNNKTQKKVFRQAQEPLPADYLQRYDFPIGLEY